MARTQPRSTVKSTEKDISRSIVDLLWKYDSIKHVVNNNYIILQSMVKNTISSLGINADNFDFEAFMDNFDIYELDLESQDTLADSLEKLLSRFIVDMDSNVDRAMETASYEIESRLREVIDYLRTNPGDNEALEYARELVRQLREFDVNLASKYASEIENLVRTEEPGVDISEILKPVDGKRLRQNRSYKKRDVRSVEVRKIREVRVENAREAEKILRQIFELLSDSRESRNWGEYTEKAWELIEVIRREDYEKAIKYEEKLSRVINNMASFELQLRVVENLRKAFFGR
jgi:polyhydroxyalkanoate synthesis regulator phasin